MRPRRHKQLPDHSEQESDADNQIGLRPGLKQNVDGKKSTRSSPLPYNIVVPTERRERATEGLLMGCAIAEALSLSRHGIHPRVGLKLFGRNPLQFQFQPGKGVTSHRTHALLMTFQAMLQSKTDPNIFSANLSKRIAWYQRVFPFRNTLIHLSRLASRVKPREFDDSMTFGLADDPLVRSLVTSLMLQGCVDSATTWFQLSVGVSHADPRVLHASMLVGYAAQLAQMVDETSFDSSDIIGRLITVTDEPKLRSLLLEISDSLTKNKTIAAFARQQGWGNGIPSDVFASSIMGIYAWLRHPKRYRNCVERTIMLGGACSSAAVIAGSLSGITLGKRGIPPEWLRHFSLFPHTSQWREQLIERVKDWPHGAEDIHQTRALPSLILGQLGRNFSFSAFQMLHGLIRFPLQLTQFSVLKRKSKAK